MGCGKQATLPPSFEQEEDVSLNLTGNKCSQ